MAATSRLLRLAACAGPLFLAAGEPAAAPAPAPAKAAVQLGVERQTPVSLGVAAGGGHMAVVVPRHTALPVKRSKKFTSGGTVEVLASEHPLLKGHYKLGHLDLRPSIPSGARVSLSFEVDLGGLLTVTAEDEDTRQIAKAFFHNYRHMHRAFAHEEDAALANATGGAWSWSPDGVFGDAPTVDLVAPAAKAPLDAKQAKGFAEADYDQDLELALGAEMYSRALVGTTLAALSLAWILIAQRGRPVTKAVARPLAGRAAEDAARAARREEELEETVRALSAALVLRGEELESCRRQAAEAVQAARRPGEEELRVAVRDEVTEQEAARFIQVQCPGVAHEDIEIAIIFNGAEVSIRRKESELAPALSWTRRFQFRLEEGHFEFKEEEARLEYGILHIVFRASTPEPRVFRFHRQCEPVSPVLSSWTFAAQHEDAPTESSIVCPETPSPLVWESGCELPAAVGDATAEDARPSQQGHADVQQEAASTPAPPPAPAARQVELSPLPTESSIICAASVATPSPRSSC